tara:strand:- start:192 stop:335 length:144 start_codon:yes stop_codon:yes gene_type:complete
MKKLLVVGGTGFIGYHIISEVKKVLKWHPKVKFSKGLSLTIKSYTNA